MPRLVLRVKQIVQRKRLEVRFLDQHRQIGAQFAVLREVFT